MAEHDNATVFAPVVAGELVVAGFTVFGAPATGGVVAVDRLSGREIWRTSFPPSDRVRASGLAGGPVVLQQEIVAASADGSIFCFGLEDGRLRRSLSMENALDNQGPRPEFRALASDGHSLLAGSLQGLVTAYRDGDRNALWRFRSPQDGSVAFNVSLNHGVAYVPFLSGRLVAIDLATGQQRWRLGSPDSPFPWPPATDGNRLFLSSPAGFFAFQV
jgi:outer membrane protein assembly factor BamB